MSYLWRPRQQVDDWFNDQDDNDLVMVVLHWLMDFCEAPEPYPSLWFEGEPVPRQYAPITGTRLILTFAITHDPDIVHGLKLEDEGGVWTP